MSNLEIEIYPDDLIELDNLCYEFLTKNGVDSEEQVYQSDKVQEKIPNFVCDIIDFYRKRGEISER